MAYIISPPLDDFPKAVGSSVALDFYTFRVPFGIPQKSQVGLPVVFSKLWKGESIDTSFDIMVHGVPGVTTQDGFFPDATQPQFRMSHVDVPEPPTYVPALYHGEPGVLRGDDNWSQETPSYQPQLRTNTIPHTEDPVLVNGTWRVNEAFLPQ